MSSGQSWRRHPLVQLTLVRYREFFREPEAVFWVFIFPILLTAGLGIAFRRTAAERMAVAVVAPGSAPGEVLQALGRDSSLTVLSLDDSAAADSLRAGRVALIVRAVSPGEVEYQYDPDRPDSRSTRLVVDQVIQQAAGQRTVIQVRDLQVVERGSRYVDFVVPGLLGMNLMGSGIWGLGFAIVSRMTLLVIEIVLLLGFAVVAFQVPIRGSLLVLVLLCVLSSLSFSALGLLIASRAKTVEGVSGLMNLVMLPMWIFSGVFFSASRFPEPIQPLIQLLPLTAVVDALRATMLQGAGASRLLPELAVIAGWLAVSFPLSLRLFRWR
jgi:ABC-2 type transport system permease protein